MTKTIDDINFYQWFGERELSFVPKHFVISSTPITDESREWIFEKLTGRFALVFNVDGSYSVFSGLRVAFEDPKEAVFYELTWS